MPLPTTTERNTRKRTPRWRRLLRDMPLRKRLITTALMGTIPLILFGIALLIGRYTQLRDVLLHTNLEQAGLASVYAEGWLQGQIRTLRTLARSNEVQRGTTEDMMALSERQLQAQTDWRFIWISDAEGSVIANTRGGTLTAKERVAINRVRQTRIPVVTNLLRNEETNEMVVDILYPIQREDTFGGVVACGVRSEELLQIFTIASKENENELSLWGEDRQLIARTGSVKDLTGHRFASDEEFDQIFSRSSGMMIAVSPITHERILMGYAPVPLANWTAVSLIPLRVAQRPLFPAFLFFILFASLVVSLSLVWSFYTANSLARQIGMLAKSARQLGEGKFETRVQTTVGGELGLLAESLNKMAGDLQKLDRMKNDLLSMVSHELKTPLTSILASLDLMSSELIPPEHPKYRDLLHIADRQSHRLQDMIENLLCVSRLDAGGLGLTLRSESLRTIILNAVKAIEVFSQEKSVPIRVEIDGDLIANIDRQKIALAMNNLLDNAVKFTDEGEITVRATREGEVARVAVTDTGIGLTPEVQEHLFEKYFQAEPLLTRKAGGAGLGLYVTREIIHAHGGEMFVSSEGLEQGATVGFLLPLAHQAPDDDLPNSPVHAKDL